MVPKRSACSSFLIIIVARSLKGRANIYSIFVLDKENKDKQNGGWLSFWNDMSWSGVIIRFVDWSSLVFQIKHEIKLMGEKQLKGILLYAFSKKDFAILLFGVKSLYQHNTAHHLSDSQHRTFLPPDYFLNRETIPKVFPCFLSTIPEYG